MKKKCKVIKLPTNDKGAVATCVFQGNEFIGLPRQDHVSKETFGVQVDNQIFWGSDYQAYHLYIISDDIIEVGDVVYIPRINERIGDRVEKCLTYAESDYFNHKSWKKVIASTNPSLNLLAIPEWFIKQYAEKPVSEVLVTHFKNERIVKMRNNEIGIHPILKKESWTKDEIEFVLQCAPPVYVTGKKKWMDIMMSKFNSVEEDMKEFEEEQRADAYKRDFEDRNFYEGL